MKITFNADQIFLFFFQFENTGRNYEDLKKHVERLQHRISSKSANDGIEPSRVHAVQRSIKNTRLLF